MQTPLTFSGSIVIAASPEALYDMVSDVTRMGEWSPVCRACWWDEGSGPKVGAWFTGRNQTPERGTWETRSQVAAASRGEEFTFVVGGNWTRWGYTFTPVPGGTRLTESWEVLPDGLRRLDERFGDGAAARLAVGFEAARTGIAATLQALKRAAEAAPG